MVYDFYRISFVIFPLGSAFIKYRWKKEGYSVGSGEGGGYHQPPPLFYIIYESLKESSVTENSGLK